MRRPALLLTLALALTACEGLPPEVGPRPLPPPPPPPAPVAPPVPTETPDDAFRKQPPAAGPEVRFVAPAIEEARLKNGIRVLLVERHELPIVSVRLVSNRGASQAAPAVGALAGAMWLSGTKSKSAEQISDAFADIGADHGAWVDYDSSQLEMTVLSGKLPQAIELLAEVAQGPTFPRDELKREKARRATSIAQEKDSPQRLLGRAVAQELYPSRHPYSLPLIGSEESLDRVNRGDLETYHRAQIEPDTLTVVAAGDVTRAELLDRLEQSMGKWRGKAEKARKLPDAKPASDAPRIVVVDRPGAVQSNVQVVTVGVSRDTRDYDALLVMNTLLGGQFSSRLNMNLREKHAYTYGAGSSFSMRQTPGPFVAGGAIVSKHTADAIKEIMAEIDAMRSQPVSDEELDNAKANLTQSLPGAFETTSQTVSSLSNIAIYNLPLDEYATRPARIARITRDDVKRVASTYLKPEALRVVLVGDAGALKPDLEKLSLGKVEVQSPSQPAKKAPPQAPKKKK